MTYTEKAWAKLNLSLDILGKRPDGYHDLRMVMQSVLLCDTITLSPNATGEHRLTTDLSFLPRDGSNIALKAVDRFCRETGLQCPGLDIHIQKRIPVCAGMAGGSSDGAAVLRLLRRLYAPEMSREQLEAIGALVGSDVPYCIRGGTALAQGRGEVLEDLAALPPCWFVICKPAFSISTPELFSRVKVKQLRCHPDTPGMIQAMEAQDLEGVARRLYNVFEDVLTRKHAQVFEIKSQLLELGAMASSMTGSGPTVFGMFRDEEKARDAAQVMGRTFPHTFCCMNVGSAV